MKRTSRASSEVRIAARSPFRSIAGPATVRIPTPSSSRTMYASARLPEPRRADEQDVVERLPACDRRGRARPRAAPSAAPGRRTRPGWRGRSERSNSSSSSSRAPGRETARLRHAAFLSASRTRSSAGELRIDPGERRARLRRPSSRARRARRGQRAPSEPTTAASSTASATFSRSSSTTRCAVFLPIPGIASNRAVSSSTIARRSSDTDDPETIAIAIFGPTPLTEIRCSNSSRSAASREPVELECVLPDDEVRLDRDLAVALGQPQRGRRRRDEIPDAVDVEDEAVRTPHDRQCPAGARSTRSPQERRRQGVADRDRERVGCVRVDGPVVSASARIVCTIRATWAFSARP